MRIQTKLAVILPSLVLLPMLMGMAYELPRVVKQLRQMELDKFEAQLQQSSRLLAQTFNNLQQEMLLYARTDNVKNLSSTQLLPYLRRERERQDKIFSYLIVADTNGHFYSTQDGNPEQDNRQTANNADPNSPPLTLIRRDYWRATVGTNPGEIRTVISNPFMSYGEKQRLIMIAASILNDQQRVVGMIGGAISWAQIEQYVKELQANLFPDFARPPKFFLTNKDGTYLYHWDEKKNVQLALTDTGEPSLNQELQATSKHFSLHDESQTQWLLAAKAIVTQQRGHFRYHDPSTNELMVVSFTPVDNTDYTVGIIAYDNQVTALSDAIAARTLLIFIAVAIATIITAHWLGKTLSRPLQRLADYAVELKQGHLPSPEKLNRNDEIGQLAHQLQDLSATTQQQQEQLRFSEERFSLAMKGSNDGVWDWLLASDELYLSPRWYEMLGYCPSSLPAKLETFFEFLHPDDIEAVQDAINRCISDKNSPLHVEFRMLHKDGHNVHILSRAHLVCDPISGKPQRLIGTHVDTTEKNQYQARIERLNQELDGRVQVRTRELEEAKTKAQALQHKAESANQAKSTFLANMSHELRTPLNSIIGFTNRLIRKLEGHIDNRNLDALNTVETNGKQLLSLINDLLDTAKIETGQLHLKRERFNCITLANQCLDQVRPMAEEKNLRLVTDYSEPELLIDADKKRVVQILLNMLSNAIKFTHEGSITLAIEPMRKGDTQGVGFHVIDTGIGIRQEQQSILFNKFTRIESSDINAVQGTGLGLSLIKELLALHQGSIEVTSTFGQGSRFTAWMPARGH